MMNDPTDPKATPSATAEGEEQDLVERSATERDPRARRAARREDDDVREDDGWTQPESSAQKAAVRDEEEG